MTLYISADMSSSFSTAWNFFISQFKYIMDSLFHIQIGGVSVGLIWLSLNIMLTVIALTITVVNNGAGNMVNTDTFNRRFGRSSTVFTESYTRNIDGKSYTISSSRRERGNKLGK